MVKTVNFGLQHVEVAASGREETINEGLATIDALLARAVDDFTLTVPPVAPVSGLWAVPAAATGAWAGQGGKLALYMGGGWIFLAPKIGVAFVDLATGASIISGGVGWALGGPIGEAPADGKIYGRQNGAWVEIVAIGGVASAFTVTVAAANVASALTAFPLKIDLRDMPADFWLGVDDGGGNIRAYAADGVTLIPHDVADCNLAEKTGILTVKTNLSALTDTVLKIGLEASGVAALAVGDANGRNAVWVDYEVAFVGPELIDRTGNHTLVQSGNIYNGRWKETARSPDLNFHQGAEWTATYIYAADTNQLRKYDGAWAQVATNADPVGDAKTATGITSLDHCGDPAVIAGELIVPIEKWNNGTGYGEAHLVVFNISDLTFNRAINISADATECSGCCEGPSGNIYVTNYTDDTNIPYFDALGVLQGTLVLSSPIAELQGITYLGGKFYVSSGFGAGKIYEVEVDGTVNGEIYESFYGGSMEGLTNNGTDLIYHKDATGAGFSGLRTLSIGTGKEEWPKFHNGRLSTTVTTATSFYMATVFQPTPDLQQGGMVSLEDGSQRVTQVCDDSPLRYATWDNSSGYVSTGPIKPLLYESRHIATGYDSTTERKVWADGAINALDAGITAKMTGGSATFIIGMAKMAGNEPLYGQMASAILRNNYPTDDWVAFEGLNHKTPSVTITIT